MTCEFEFEFECVNLNLDLEFEFEFLNFWKLNFEFENCEDRGSARAKSRFSRAWSLRTLIDAFVFEGARACRHEASVDTSENARVGAELRDSPRLRSRVAVSLAERLRAWVRARLAHISHSPLKKDVELPPLSASETRAVNGVLFHRAISRQLRVPGKKSQVFTAF